MTDTAPLQDLTALVRPLLDRLNRDLVLDLQPRHDEMKPMVDLVAGYRGKQLRGALVFLGAMAARGQAHCASLPPELLTVAKVVELLHTATLVHDDVLDGADLRRRIPTVNAMHGTETAVLLGDYLYAKAFHMAVELEDPACARWLAETVRVICQGEITQILHRFDFDWTEQRYFEVIAEKTASLYAAACRLGGYYARGTEPRVRALEAFGQEVGIAFQIVDDCLDLSGDERVVGKSLGTDLAKGKLTLPLLYLIEGDQGARERLGRITGLDEKEGLRQLRAEFPLEDAVSRAMGEAEQRVRRALRRLSALPVGPARSALEQIAAFVLARRV
ncbi:MAG: polyprenyl synthetase family protein [Planctomycetota bacterium]